MADNYIEKRMEELRSGALGRGMRARCASDVPREGAGFMKGFAGRRVLLLGGDGELGREMVESLREVGCRVAFTGCDAEAGKELARRTGSQFHPFTGESAGNLDNSARLLVRNWRDLDVVVVNRYGPGGWPVCVDEVAEELARVGGSLPLSPLSGVVYVEVVAEGAVAASRVGANLVPVGSGVDAASVCAVCRMLVHAAMGGVRGAVIPVVR